MNDEKKLGLKKKKKIEGIVETTEHYAQKFLVLTSERAGQKMCTDGRKYFILLGAHTALAGLLTL